MAVYIVSRGRAGNLRKIIPAWLAQNMLVTIVTERKETAEYRKAIKDGGWHNYVDVIPLPRVNGGVGYARQFVVDDAYKSGLESFIMSDDDMRPAEGSEMCELLIEAARPGTLGVGSVRGLHNWFSGGAVSENNGLILCPSGWGMQLFALNTAMTLRIGGFDTSLDCFGEDAELMRQGIARGIPWLVHCGVYSDAIGARHAPGGMDDLVGGPEARKVRELACHRIIHERWPKYVSEPGKRFRMAWQKMLTDYIPGWRERSALHGGKL